MNIVISHSILLLFIILFNACGGGGGDEATSSPGVTPPPVDTNNSTSLIVPTIDNLEFYIPGDILASAKNFEDAQLYCQNLDVENKNDWRLPSYGEYRYAYVYELGNYIYWTDTKTPSTSKQALIFSGFREVLLQETSLSSPVSCIRGPKALSNNPELFGLWFYVQKGYPLYITENTKFKDFTVVNENQITVLIEDEFGNDLNATLVRNSIPDVSLSGEIILSKAISSAPQRRGSSHPGDISIILKNYNLNTEKKLTLAVANDINISGTVVNNILFAELNSSKLIIPKNSELTTQSGLNEITIVTDDTNTTVEMQISGEQDDIGILHDKEYDGYNLKAEFFHPELFGYFANDTIQATATYTQYAKICNYSDENITEFSFYLDTSDPLITTFSYGNIKYSADNKCIEFIYNIEFNRPTHDTDVTVPVTVSTAPAGTTEVINWIDKVIFHLNAAPYNPTYLSLEKNYMTLNNGIYALFVGLGNKVYEAPFSAHGSSFVRVPSDLNSSYNIIVSTTTENQDYKYMIGVGSAPNFSKLYETNSTADSNEPNNDYFTATQLSSVEDETLGYLDANANDIDFFYLSDFPKLSKQYTYQNSLNIPRNSQKVNLLFVSELNTTNIENNVFLTDMNGTALGASIDYNQTINILSLNLVAPLNNTDYMLNITKELTTQTGFSIQEDFQLPLKSTTEATFKTGQTSSFATADDGAVQTGLNTLFYRDDINLVVTDYSTNLMWQDDADIVVNSRNVHTSTDAAAYCSSLTLAGYSDWRIPNIKELLTLTQIGGNGIANINSVFENLIGEEYMNGFGGTEVLYYLYWSGTLYAGNTPYWVFRVEDGNSFPYFQATTDNFITRCVRGEELALEPTCSVGECFVRDNSTNIVRDLNSSLIWQDTAFNSSLVTWQEALGYCENLDLAGYTNWRVPNKKELESIVNYSTKEPSISPIFQNTEVNYRYWSSTTVYEQILFSDYSSAYLFSFNSGSSSTVAKTNSHYIRCVTSE